MPQEIVLPKLTEEEAVRRIIKWLKSPKTEFYSRVNSPNYGHELYIPDVIIQCYQEVIDEDKRRHPVEGMRQYSMNLNSPDAAVFYDAAWILCRVGLLRPNPPNPHANGEDINKGYTVTSNGKKWLSQFKGDESELAKLLSLDDRAVSTEVETSEVNSQSAIPTLRKEKPGERKVSNDPLASTIQDNTGEQILNNRYKILRTLSRGGFGQTFLAEDMYLPSKCICVIKQLTFSSNDPDVQKLVSDRFELEAATLERLAKSNEQIPKLYAHFTENGQFYLAQEWIRGETVANRVMTTGKCDETTVKNLLISILPVLEYVHSNRIIHRDIKPENIILREEDGKPVLIDFGAIKEITRTIIDPFGNPTTTIFIGTPAFVPIEQVTGRPVFASDLYSLGLTAIYMLTGKRPQELTDPSTGSIVWHAETINVSATFAEVLDKSIQHDFRDRFLSASAMLDAVIKSSEDNLLNTPPSSNKPIDGSSLVEAQKGDVVIRPTDNSGHVPPAMSQTATWWLRSFLNPVIDVVRHVEKGFNQNSFVITAHSLQLYSQVYNYRIDFFNRAEWERLLSSDVSEYFFDWFPSIAHQLKSFTGLMDEFDNSLSELEQSLEASPEFLKNLIDTYERMIQHERILRSQYERSSLQEIAVLLLGQLHLQLSNYQSESKDNLVRFTAYTLMDLNIEYPAHVLPDDRKLLSFCREISKCLSGKDASITKCLEESKRLFEVIKSESASLLKQLKRERINIAKKYTATFEQ